MAARREEAEMIFRRVGITFAVYGAKDEDGSGTERLIPFDLIPRIIPAHEWQSMEEGLVQRVTALNRFIHDVYHDQEIIKAGIVPADQIFQNAQFRPEMMGVDVPHNIYSHISGVDIVRAPNADGVGEYYVLEDNLRVPSGVSYMLEDRKMMMRLFPELFGHQPRGPGGPLPRPAARDPARRRARPPPPSRPSSCSRPACTTAPTSSTPSWRSRWAWNWSKARTCFVKDNFVYMRTTRGPKRVDVIYRRVDDDFLDPSVFRPTSTLGCAGLLGVYRSGNVAICNAVGTGVADDKSIYPYVPKMIEFYLGQKPILNNVPTFMGRDAEDLKYMMANLKDLVVKEVHGAGGYGMLVGPASTKAEIEEFRKAVQANPSGYIAQPTLSLSTCPTYVESGMAPAPHRPATLRAVSGKEVQMVPGGLTRVALKDGSLVVNSSRAAGTKDTWILED